MRCGAVCGFIVCMLGGKGEQKASPSEQQAAAVGDLDH